MSVTLYKPKHRREVSTTYSQRQMADPSNDATCDLEGKYIGASCLAMSRYCPRHSPEAYADHMARHAGGPNPSLPKISGFNRTEVDW